MDFSDEDKARNTHNVNMVTGGLCEGQGCRYVIEPGLALRFCPICRLKQPVPTSTQSLRRRKKYRTQSQAREAKLKEAEDYRRTYER